MIKQPSEIAIKSPLLTRYAEQVTHAFCTRQGGVSAGCYTSLNFSHKEGDSRQNVEINTKIIAAHFEMSADNFYTIKQVHGEDVLIVEEETTGAASGKLGAMGTGNATGSVYEGDGLLTRLSNIALCVKTADCVPVLLFAPKAKVIGAIHAGWRGVALNIAAKAVEIMATKFGVERRAIVAAIGPAIGACCYEVDETVRRPLQSWENCFTPAPRAGKWLLDIKEANRRQLLAAGLLANNVEVNPLCTACEERLFFSHRREKGKTGRMLNFIALKPSII